MYTLPYVLPNKLVFTVTAPLSCIITTTTAFVCELGAYVTTNDLKESLN